MNADTTANHTRLRLVGRTLIGATGVLVASAGLAFAVDGASGDHRPAETPPVETPPEETPAVTPRGGEGTGDDASAAGLEEAEAHRAEAEAHHASAEAFAEGIQSWTDCIADNAANTPPEERGEDFDPKDGCEAPATTPSDEPFDPGAEDDPAVDTESGAEAGDAGPPEDVPAGPPEATPQGRPDATPQGPPASDD